MNLSDVRRYAEYSAAIVGINETFPHEQMNRLLAYLQVHFISTAYLQVQGSRYSTTAYLQVSSTAYLYVSSTCTVQYSSTVHSLSGC